MWPASRTHQKMEKIMHPETEIHSPASQSMEPFGHLSEIGEMERDYFEKRCRSHTGNAYLGDHTLLCRILTRYKMFVNSRDLGVVPHLIMDGFWESWLTQCMARVIKPHHICLDIGANFGYFTLLMSELANKGRTIAIEPNPEIARYLVMTKSVHAPFEVVETALSNFEGKIDLVIPVDHPGSASITSKHQMPEGAQKKIEVKVQSLDKLVADLGLPRVDIIKIDVEGVEPEVFEGAKELFEKNPDLQIFMEYSPFAYEDPKAFTEFIFSRFKVNRIKDVDRMTLLDESSIPDLVALTDHTDLYLSRKEPILNPAPR
jgi:FkbM family methyltransferase